MQPSRQTSIPKAQSRQPSAEVSQQEALETAQSASWQHDSLLSPIGTIANPSAHAELLQRASLGQSSSPSQFLLQLQRRYGNRYVNQVLQRSQQPNSTAISTTPSALEQSIPPKHPIAPEHRSNTANPPVSENLGIPVIQRKKGGSKEAPKTTHQPTANQPAPLNSTWQNAPLLNDPKLRVEHQRVIDDAKAKNQNWYLMPGATVAPMNGGAIGQPTPLGNKNPEPVTEKQDVTSFKISQGTQIYSTASFKLLPQLTTHDVEVVPQPKSQDDQGNAGYVVNFPFAGPNSIALPLWFYEAALQPGVQGHLIRSGRTPYWIAQNNAHLQQLNAFIDRTQEPLFPEDPTPEQVLQGELGDCYLMAALASITQANPDFPKEMMLDNNNGTVTVRLYEISHAGFFKPFKATKRLIRVNKSAPHKQGKDVYAREYLWVQW
ncbi:MAG: hypothetical protein HC865_09080 [Cyanobacteria bacterium RU_5_0]|nr:hypothetical protein [Cyanobacteria bacterium RU_5_0]